MSAFDDDFAAADAMFGEAFGAPVVCVLGAVTLNLTAQPVLQDYEVDQADVAISTIRARDYLIARDDWTTAGGTGSPRTGMWIKETINGVMEVFEAMPLGEKPAVELTDVSGASWIVHTKHIGNE